MPRRTRERVETEVPPALRTLLQTHAVSDALLERALAAGIPARTIMGWAGWRKLDDAELERQIGWHQRFTLGDLRGREATEADNEAFCDLWENSPEEIGDLEVTVLRGPDGFAQFRLQGNVHLHVIADGNVLAASCGWSRRNVEIAGKRVSVRYGQALRVHRDYRRQGLGDSVRMLSSAMNAVAPSVGQYDIMRSGNFAVVGWWKKYVPGFFEGTPQREGEVPGIPVAVAQIPARASAGSNPRIRPGRRADLAQCVALLNRTHGGLDLFRPYTEEFLEYQLDEGYWGERQPRFPTVYGWRDFYVLEVAGRIHACAGLWDRGRDLRERIRDRKSGREQVFAGTALLDWGYAEGAEDAMVELVGELAARSLALGRDFLSVPLDHTPILGKRLESLEPDLETRYLRWANASPAITRPYTDLRWW